MRWSSSSAVVADELAAVLDTSRASRVVDVGGASGVLIAALLMKNLLLEGAILERPDAVARASAAVAEKGLASRCRVVAAGFFADVPEADIFVLKSIIHDWDDAQSELILSNCARALRPKGRVVLVEVVAPDDDRPSWAPLMDLNMLAVLPGRSADAPVSRINDLFPCVLPDPPRTPASPLRPTALAHVRPDRFGACRPSRAARRG